MWDHPANKEHLDIIDGFEGRFARARSPFPAPLVVVTASNGDSDEADQAIWLDLSPDATQVTVDGGHNIWFDAPQEVAVQILAIAGT